MRYSIEGGSLPVVIINLNLGERLISEAGGRRWMRGDIRTETESHGGIGSMFGRMLSGESLFLSSYTAFSESEIAFASSFPGKIIARELRNGESIVCQKSAFLCATDQVSLRVFFQKNIGSGYFGGEGFIMQKITGPGMVFLELDGYIKEYDLAPNESIVCDTGAVAMIDETCQIDVRVVSGLKNIVFGGEGLFDTVVTGPGKVALQSASITDFSKLISSCIKTK